MSNYNIYHKNKNAKCPHGFGLTIANQGCMRCGFSAGLDSPTSINCKYEHLKKEEQEEKEKLILQEEIKKEDDAMFDNMPVMDKYESKFYDYINYDSHEHEVD